MMIDVGREAAIDRRRVDDRLERRAELTLRLHRAIELAALEAASADHREDLAGAVVERDHRAFDLRLLFERAGDRARRGVDGR